MDEKNSDGETGRNGKAAWTYRLEKIFVELLQAAVVQHNTRRVDFKRSTWVAMTKDFNAATGNNWKLGQLKGKIRRWKKECKIWQRIKDHTGVGWDNERNVPTYHDWNVLERAVKGAKKFENKTFPLFNELHELLKESTADARRGISPAFQPIDFDVDDDDPIDLNDDAESESNDEDSPSLNKGKRPIEEHSGGKGKGSDKGKKKSKGESTIESSIRMFNSVQKAKLQQTSARRQAVQILNSFNLDPTAHLKAFTWL